MRNGETIWRAPGFGSKEGVAVKRTPFLASCHNTQDGTRLRGGQAIALPTDAITVKFLGEPNVVMAATVARSLKTDIRLGDPVIVELDGPTGYAVVALHGGKFAGGGPVDQEASVTAGEFSPSIVTENFWNS